MKTKFETVRVKPIEHRPIVTDDMVEVAACAIRRVEYPGLLWKDATPYMKQVYRDQARAALTAVLGVGERP